MGSIFFTETTIKNGHNSENLIRNFSSEPNFHRERMLIAVSQRSAFGYKLEAMESTAGEDIRGKNNDVVAVSGKAIRFIEAEYQCPLLSDNSVRCRFRAILDGQNNLISYQLSVNDSVARQENDVLVAIADEFFNGSIDHKVSILYVGQRAQIISFLAVAEQAFFDKVSYVTGNDPGQFQLQLLDRVDQKLNEEVTYNTDRMVREGPGRVQEDASDLRKDAARDFLYQYATVSALQAGVYDGNVTLGELKKRGDFGLGTFNGVDGELVVNEGKFYRIHSSGTVSEVSDCDQTSLAFVKFFRADLSFTIQSEGITLEQLQKRIASLLAVDKLYAIRISGTFSKITARASALAQKPYQPLKEHLAQNQVIFNLTNSTGVAVGFLVPTSMEKVNIPGFHFHYISDDLKSGGHVFDFTANQLTVEIDKTTGCYLELNTIST